MASTTASLSLRFCDDINTNINSPWVRTFTYNSILGPIASTLKDHFAEMKVTSVSFYRVPSASAISIGDAVFVAGEPSIVPEKFKYSSLISTARASIGRVGSFLSTHWKPTPRERETMWWPIDSPAALVRVAFMTNNCTATNGLENALRWELITDIRVQFKGLNKQVYLGQALFTEQPVAPPNDDFEHLDIE